MTLLQPTSELEIISDADISETTSSFRELSIENVDDEFLKLIPRDFARQHLLIAQGFGSDGAMILAISETTDPSAAFNVGVRLGKAVQSVVGDSQTIARIIDEAYGHVEKNHDPRAQTNHSVSGVGDEELVDGGVGGEVERLLVEADRDLLATAGKAPMIKLVDALLFEALSRRASDVHIQPLSDRTLVRYRLDGVLHTVRELSMHITSPLISRIKVMGRMDIAERRVPQDGRSTVTIGKRKIDLRISTLPTSYGERAVIRLLDNTEHLCDFELLGMPPEVEKAYLGCAGRSCGILLVTGPTGSGKTTTLYSTLGRIANPGVNIMTIEDPIEYELSTVGLTISQSQVNTKKGITFATGLRHILRQDPDIVMVGEIRDQETARIAIQSSLTGHLVFSTLHTNDAPSAVTRLIDLGIEPYLVSASLNAVLAQRLVRVVHASCTGGGCPECLGTGFRGRTGLYELMVISEPLRGLISRSAELADIRRQARLDDLRTLREEGERLVAKGRTTVAEVERVIAGAV